MIIKSIRLLLETPKPKNIFAQLKTIIIQLISLLFNTKDTTKDTINVVLCKFNSNELKRYFDKVKSIKTIIDNQSNESYNLYVINNINFEIETKNTKSIDIFINGTKEFIIIIDDDLGYDHVNGDVYNVDGFVSPRNKTLSVSNSTGSATLYFSKKKKQNRI